MARKKNKQAKGKKGGNAVMSTRRVGAYANVANQAVVTRTRAPRMIPRENGVIVCNTEKFRGVGATLAAGASLKEVWGINPASGEIFPWLSTIARAYSKYRWKSLSMYWTPHVGTNVSGLVSLASTYDAEDAFGYAQGPANVLVNTSTQSEYCEAPPYAGGSLNVAGAHNDNTTNFVGIHFDVARMHESLKWFIIDPSFDVISGQGDYARVNQCEACQVVIQYRNGAATQLELGSWYMSYEIELLHPSNPVYQAP